MKTWQLALVGLTLAGAAYAQRPAPTMVGRDPIPAEVENAYLRGLKHLAGTQKADGSWGDQNGQEPGVVGLAVMAMLAHGDDPNVGPYKDAVRKGVRFILACADAKTGQIGAAATKTMYSHGFATLALAEAYGMVDEPLIGPTLQRAVDFVVACQKRNKVGAWRYSAESQDADTTVSGAQMVALLAARNAGILVPDDAIEKGLKYYRSCQSEGGGIGYAGPSGGNVTLTGIGLLVFTLARQKESAAWKNAAGYFRQNMPGQSAYPFYHEYYTSQAAFHLDEATWQAWNSANITRMLRMQDPTTGAWSSSGTGACFGTAGALLSLALNYRYLPIYER
jgi:hypothetical protein